MPRTCILVRACAREGLHVAAEHAIIVGVNKSQLKSFTAGGEDDFQRLQPPRGTPTDLVDQSEQSLSRRPVAHQS